MARRLARGLLIVQTPVIANGLTAHCCTVCVLMQQAKTRVAGTWGELVAAASQECVHWPPFGLVRTLTRVSGRLTREIEL